ncbi:hypothetical protein F4860DRAFT_458435 [Xylaria cubensis]|nr:hypothetical protein F4860DRAFT_458435 [Xylaria cubensis]
MSSHLLLVIVCLLQHGVVGSRPVGTHVIKSLYCVRAHMLTYTLALWDRAGLGNNSLLQLSPGFLEIGWGGVSWMDKIQYHWLETLTSSPVTLWYKKHTESIPQSRAHRGANRP